MLSSEQELRILHLLDHISATHSGEMIDLTDVLNQDASSFFSFFMQALSANRFFPPEYL